MPDFMTEKEIEAYLEMETREIPHPDGRTLPMTALRGLWVSLDCVTSMSSFTLDDLVGFATVTMREKHCGFKEAFEAVVAFAHRELRRANGYT
ncbi:MAG: hypothetical protein AAFV54_01360 [Pseudomonadota bacterium]